jgi:hypothetical protein
MDLQTLILSIGASVQQAGKAMELNAINMFMDYFHKSAEEDNISWSPKVEVISIPRPDGTKAQLTVPVMTLANHSNITLD